MRRLLWKRNKGKRKKYKKNRIKRKNMAKNNKKKKWIMSDLILFFEEGVY